MLSEKNTVSLLNSPITHGNDNRKRFVVPLYGCFDYISPITKEKRCCPLFCPIAMICTPNILGTVTSRLHDEEPYECCPMGKDGIFCWYNSITYY